MLNNLEYDHADIFPDLGAIETQFHHLVRTVPGVGRLVVNAREAGAAAGAGARLLERERSCSAPTTARLEPRRRIDDGSFDVALDGAAQGTVRWNLSGEHNRLNALAAIAAARHVGVPPAQAIDSLARFESVKRRMEVRGVVDGVTVYDDFAHHPTAIATTVAGLRQAGRRRAASWRCWSRAPTP